MATADQLQSRCKIEIVGVDLAASEPVFLTCVMARLARHVPSADLITVFCSEPQAEGWLEWMIVIAFKSGSSLTIGALRRTPGGEVEFHS